MLQAHGQTALTDPVLCRSSVSKHMFLCLMLWHKWQDNARQCMQMCKRKLLSCCNCALLHQRTGQTLNSWSQLRQGVPPKRDKQCCPALDIRDSQHKLLCARVSLTWASPSSITWMLGNLSINKEEWMQLPTEVHHPAAYPTTVSLEPLPCFIPRLSTLAEEHFPPRAMLTLLGSLLKFWDQASPPFLSVVTSSQGTQHHGNKPGCGTTAQGAAVTSFAPSTCK